jgi:hypothetical protein
VPTAASSRSEPAARGPALPPAWAEGEAAARLPRYLGTALAAALAGPAAQVSDEAVRQDALAARFRLQRQIDCLAALRDAGLTAVALKGFVTAHWLYPQPALRCSGDLDVLLPRGDLQAALELLSAEGYAFRPLPPKPWGFLSRASFQPFASADGVVNLDLHVEPDCWPLERGLPAADLLAAARPMPGLPALAPDPTHLFLLLASNAAKDKFGPFAVKKVLDAYVWLAGAGAGEGSRQAPPLDGAELHRRAQAAGLLRPLGVFLALLADLGVPAARLPDIPPHRPGRAYARLLADWRGSFPEAPSALQRLAREAALGAEPSVAATLAWRRLTGLVRRPTGLPEGWA